jgi:hypothetical protein
MRDLLFNVKGQELKKDVNCNFGNLVAGSENYLNCKFKFSQDWEGFGKVAVFKNAVQDEYAVIIRNGECLIPNEALTGNKFTLIIRGLKQGVKLITNSITIEQTGGK